MRESSVSGILKTKRNLYISLKWVRQFVSHHRHQYITTLQLSDVK